MADANIYELQSRDPLTEGLAVRNAVQSHARRHMPRGQNSPFGKRRESTRRRIDVEISSRNGSISGRVPLEVRCALPMMPKC